MIAVACVAIVCGTSLTAWVLYLRQKPTVTAEQYAALAATVSQMAKVLERHGNALAVRKAVG